MDERAVPVAGEWVTGEESRAVHSPFDGSEVGRVPVLLLRSGDAIHAVQDWCPHAGGPLSQGTFDGDVAECPWHQSRFCLADGAPLQGPAASPLRTFAVREAGGRILVCPSDEAKTWPPAPEPPLSLSAAHTAMSPTTPVV